MTPVNIMNIVLWIVVIQLSTILHELGHALPILAFTRHKATVTLGRGGMNVNVTIRRLKLHLKGFAPWIGFVGVEEGASLGKPLLLLLSLGGPLISFLTGTAAFLARPYTDLAWLYSVLSIATLYNWYLFLITIIPVIYPKWWSAYGGTPSDGYRIFKLLIAKKNTVRN